jgi:methionyl-tRNA formyltransferase
MKRLRLAFMGSPDFAVPALQALHEAGHDVAAVYTQPPRPAGRGHKETPCPVHRKALELGLPVHNPTRLRRNEAEHRAFAALGLDAAVVAAYGLLLPYAMLGAPRLGCLNIHASLLPRWRGAAPIQAAILAGDLQTGITIMQMDAGLDTGAMLLSGTIPIGARATTPEIHDALSMMGRDLILKVLEEQPEGVPQPADGATYAPKLTKEDGRLSWQQSCEDLDRRIRALNPWPGTYFIHQGQAVRVLEAVPEAATVQAAPGTVMDEAPKIACGQGALRLLRLQRAGRSGMDAEAFLRGYSLPAGTMQRI